MKQYFFDYEVYPNCLLGIFIDLNTPQQVINNYVSADIDNNKEAMAVAMEAINPVIFITMFDDERIVDQLDDMLLFIDNPDVMVIGFNNNLYDDIITNYLIIKLHRLGLRPNAIKVLEEVYEVNDTIINGAYQTILYDSLFKDYKARYYSMDCFQSLYETVHRKSLKQTMINLKWYNVLDLPIKPGTHITWDMLDGLIYYCNNDVLGTRAFYFYNIKEIEMKMKATLLYGTMLLNKNRSSIADALLQKMYMERSGLTYWQIKDLRTFRNKIKLIDILDTRLQFDAPVFKEYHEMLKVSTLIAGNDKQLNAKLPFKGNRYDIAKGGLHSKDMPGVFKSTDKYAIIDGDADSYYPRSVINDKICPAHLFQPIFTAIGEYLTNARLDAKHLKTIKLDATLDELNDAKTIADVLKIVINSGIFG